MLWSSARATSCMAILPAAPLCCPRIRSGLWSWTALRRWSGPRFQELPPGAKGTTKRIGRLASRHRQRGYAGQQAAAGQGSGAGQQMAARDALRTSRVDLSNVDAMLSPLLLALAAERLPLRPWLATVAVKSLSNLVQQDYPGIRDCADRVCSRAAQPPVHPDQFVGLPLSRNAPRLPASPGRGPSR